MVACQTSEAEGPGSNPASPTMILGRCRIIVVYCKISGKRGEPPPEAKKKKKCLKENVM